MRNNVKPNFFLKKEKAHLLKMFCLSTLEGSSYKFRFLYHSIASFKIVFHRIDFASLKCAEINLVSTEFHLQAVPRLRL